MNCFFGSFIPISKSYLDFKFVWSWSTHILGMAGYYTPVRVLGEFAERYEYLENTMKGRFVTVRMRRILWYPFKVIGECVHILSAYAYFLLRCGKDCSIFYSTRKGFMRFLLIRGNDICTFSKYAERIKLILRIIKYTTMWLYLFTLWTKTKNILGTL